MRLDQVPAINLLNQFASEWTLLNDCVEDLRFSLQVRTVSEKLQGKLLDLSTLKLSQGIFEVEDTKLLHFSLKFLNLFLFREKTDECWEYIKIPQLMYLSIGDHLEKLWSNLLADDCCLDHNGSLVLEYILEFLCV